MLALLPIMLSIIVVLIFRFINKRYKPPIFGVYQQGNKYYWIKFIAMYIALRVKQLVEHVKWIKAVEFGNSFDGTVHIHEHDVALEQKHPLANPLSVDGVYFNGMSKKGAAVVCGIARRTDQTCDAFLYLKLESGELLLTPDLPDTYLKQSLEEEGEYSVQGMSIFNFIPMRTWKLSYNGEMKPRSDAGKRVTVSMHLTWSAAWPIYDSNTHISPSALALDLAREPWGVDYFRQLIELQQIHYEQLGFIEGSVFIDGHQHIMKMPCARHHSAAKVRDWRNYHRYVYHFIYLENGDCIAVGSFSNPMRVSHLTLGYVCRARDQAVMPVRDCDFRLWQQAENQQLPEDYGFVFKAGGDTYEVQIQVQDSASFYVGKLRESRVHERWAAADVNGAKGWACVEWQYNNAAGMH